MDLQDSDDHDLDGDLSIKLKRLAHGQGLELPRYETAGAAGMDLRAALLVDERVSLLPGERALIPTGLQFEIPPGFEAQVRPRSGLAVKHGVSVLNSPGTIDSDYRGEVKVILINHGQETFHVVRGERIAQMIVAPVFQTRIELVDELGDSVRGAGGFGSTGKVN